MFEKCDKKIIFNIKHIFFQMSFVAIVLTAVNDTNLDMIFEKHNKMMN